MPSTATTTAPVIGSATLVEELPVQPHTFTKIDAMPLAKDAIEALTDLVVGMNPQDIEMKLSDVRMDQNGRVCRVSTKEDDRTVVINPEGETARCGGGANYTASGLAHCVSFMGTENDPAPRSFTTNLFYQPGKIRAFMFNEAVKRSDRKDEDTLMFRFLSHPFSKVRVLRAVTSKKHTLKYGDTAAIISRLMNRPEILNGTARASLRYTWDRVSLDFYFPRTVNGVIAGAVPFVRIVLSETKEMAWSVTSGLYLGSGLIALASQSTQDMEKTTGRHVGVNVATNMVKGYEHAMTLTDKTYKAIEAAKLHVLGVGEFHSLARTCGFDTQYVVVGEGATTYDVAMALMKAATETTDELAHGLQLAAARVMQTAVSE